MGSTPSSDRDDLDVQVRITDGGQQMEPPEEEEEGEDQEDVEITREGDEETSEEESEEAQDTASEGEEEEEASSEEEQAESDEEAEAEDGEEASEPDEEEAEEGEEASEQDEEEAEEGEEASESEEESAEEGEEEESGDETTVLDLTLDGLYLDLLGLEVDLDEVNLDINAVPGEGKLLGNLLSAVSGLLDSPGALLGGSDGGLLPSLPDMPSLSPIERAKSLASGIADRLRNIGDGIVSAIPFEQILSQFFEALVQSLIPDSDGDGGEESAEGEAAAA